MRTLWIIISTLALANLLALIGLIAWLGMTGRLSDERVRAVRDVFVVPVAEEEAMRAAAEAEAEAERAAREREAFLTAPPKTAADTIRDDAAAAAAEVEGRSRLSREAQDLRRTLAQELAQIEAARTALAQEREAFEAMRQRLIDLEGSEQFEKAVRLYQSLKPRQAKDILQTLIDQGEIEQVVLYLNAMQTRQATKILEEFEDPVVAADLLERLRTRGLEVAASTEP